MPFEVPVFPAADPLKDYQIADGRTVNVRLHGVENTETTFGDGNGDGHAAPGERFAVLLPDELMFGSPNCLAQMVEAYEKVGGNIVAALEVPASETHKYGVIDPGATDGRLTEIRGMVEKPTPGTAPSNLMLPGRYILQPEVMRELDAQEPGAGGEIQLTDAMAKLVGTQPFHAYLFDGARYDCGSAEGFVIANLAMAVEREDVGPAVRAFIARL